MVEVADGYEARTPDGALVGVAERVRRGDGASVFPHTEVVPSRRGQGVASALAARALGDARERGELVVPACRFFQVYLRAHPEHADLVAPQR